MINLNEKERGEILSISQEFIRIHAEIMSVEETIKNLEIRSSELIQELEECRNAEKKFSKDLSKKYGEGSLDPMGLVWKKEIMENEIVK